MNPNTWIKTWQIIILKNHLDGRMKHLQENNPPLAVRMTREEMRAGGRRAIVCYAMSHYYLVMVEGDKPPVIYTPEGVSHHLSPATVIRKLKRELAAVVDNEDPKGSRYARRHKDTMDA